MENKLEIELANAKMDRKAKLSSEWYNRNKLRLQTSYSCECGGRYTKSNLTSHEKSGKHISYIDKMVAILHKIEYFDLDKSE